LWIAGLFYSRDERAFELSIGGVHIRRRRTAADPPVKRVNKLKFNPFDRINVYRRSNASTWPNDVSILAPGPRPKQIGTKTILVDGKPQTVRVMEPRPANDYFAISD